MEKNDLRYAAYIGILKKELVPAMGCTEPIALAYCAAKARATLGSLPEEISIEASGNIVKNVKSVIVPHTNGKRGIDSACAIGVLAGDENKRLEVLSSVTAEDAAKLCDYLKKTRISVATIESEQPLDITVRVKGGGHSAAVRICGKHTDVMKIEKDGAVIFLRDEEKKASEDKAYGLLSVEGIYDFAVSVDTDEVAEILDRQLEYNSAISSEGLKGSYGANIGSVLLDAYGDCISNRAKARAAAGLDARMNGCELPVIINSGSGNQGMTTSLPVLEYAEELNVPKDKLYRALVVSNLLAVHLKTGIGTLSAYCGVVTAGAAAGAGIAFLRGGDLDAISHTVVNALAITSGIICDGAKASCAAKIATSVEAGIFGYEMYLRGQQFISGDGIVSSCIEKTIRNVSLLGRVGMKETDKEILEIMTCFD